jgi:hypothetical protein
MIRLVLANKGGRVVFRQGPTGHGPQPEIKKCDDGQRNKRFWNVGELRERFVVRKVDVDKQRDRPIDPYI